MYDKFELNKMKVDELYPPEQLELYKESYGLEITPDGVKVEIISLFKLI